MLTLNHVVEIQKRLEQNDAGIRKIPGTVLVNPASGAVIYTPPQEYQTILRLMDNLMAYINNQEMHDVDPLIKMAVIHYQFETIHPFLDGNGRIGRLLITLYLVSNKLLLKPTLYLSEYFELHRGQYYDALTRVRESNDIGHWVRLFLQAVVDTAEKGKITFDNILSLHRNIENDLVKLGRRAENAKRLLMHLYQSPAITVKQVEEVLGIQYYAANMLINSLVEMEILVESTGYARNRVFIFKRYVDTFVG